MKNKEQKILQDWINTLQGIVVRGMDSKTRLEARLLRKAWLDENKKIENKIPDRDEPFYQNIRAAIKKKKHKTPVKNLWASFFENKFKAFLVVILGTGFVYASKKTYDGVVSISEELNHIVLAKETTDKITKDITFVILSFMVSNRLLKDARSIRKYLLKKASLIREIF